MFRPAQQYTHACAAQQPTLSVTHGPLVTEIKQSFSSWATHVIRLTKNSPFVEIEWTAGPIPVIDNPNVPPPTPLPAPGGCVGWFQTQNCNPDGPLDPPGLHTQKSCTTVISSGTGQYSGYCLCAKGVRIKSNSCAPPGGGTKSCEELCDNPIAFPTPKHGKEMVLKFSSGLESAATFFTDSNGREMVKRTRNARGPSYPPYVVGEPVAGNYYPVNSMISLDDGKSELAVIVDTSMGASSMADGELELMVHRRIQRDDGLGVGEPLNETMCGCNDIGATPGEMGAHGHEGDGGCDCEGLTVRGSAYLILDTLQGAHATRRQLIEALNFPPTLAFSKGAPTTPTMSAIMGELPPNVKLLTVSSNYQAWNSGRLLLRLAHLYAVGEHARLSQPATFSLATVFAKAGLKVVSAAETTLTANQPKAGWEAKKKKWPTGSGYDNTDLDLAQLQPVVLDEADVDMMVTIRAMEVKTYLVEVLNRESESEPAAASSMSPQRCELELSKDCPGWRAHHPEMCKSCAESHEADLIAHGCTVASVTALCKSADGNSTPPGPGAKLVLLDSTPGHGGLCLDGSPAGFYYEPNTAENASRTWMIYLQGGGACYTKEGCVGRSKQALGSSTQWPKTMAHACSSCGSKFSGDFDGAHHVYVKYCTGDTFKGTRTTVSNETWGLHFDGHLNFARILDTLVAKYGLIDESSTKILLWGGSAGGIGTFVNADFLSARFQESIVKAAPDAGFFFPRDPLSLPNGCGTPLDYDDWAAGPPYNDDPYDSSIEILWQSYVHKSCADHYRQNLGAEFTWYCGSVSNLCKTHNIVCRSFPLSLTSLYLQLASSACRLTSCRLQTLSSRRRFS